MEGLGDNETLKAAVSKTLGMWESRAAGSPQPEDHSVSVAIVQRHLCWGQSCKGRKNV